MRDIYAVGDDKLLIVTTDRLSAFEVILPDPIPGKGAVLTAVANFWFGKLAHVVPNQLTGIDPETVVADDERDQVRGRALVETARGLLMHEIVLDGDTVAEYFIVAPTEWNFHPQGPLAGWLGTTDARAEGCASAGSRAVREARARWSRLRAAGSEMSRAAASSVPLRRSQ